MFLIVLQMDMHMHAAKLISPKPIYGKQTYIGES